MRIIELKSDFGGAVVKLDYKEIRAIQRALSESKILDNKELALDFGKLQLLVKDGSLDFELFYLSEDVTNQKDGAE